MGVQSIAEPTEGCRGANMRIVCVQNGNFTAAHHRFASGGAEDYKGQRYTVDAFSRFVEGIPHLIVSMDAPPHYERDGVGEFCGVWTPPSIRWIPRRINEWVRAVLVLKALARFRPTHLVMGCNDIVGCKVLQWAIRHGVKTAVITASYFRKDHPPFVRLCHLANDPSVSFVANHNRAATASLVECGLDPSKAVMWDLPDIGLAPDHLEPKIIVPGEPIELLTAATLIKSKGVLDVVEACSLLRGRGLDVRLSLCGDGPLASRLQNHEGIRQGWLRCPGKVPHDDVIERMKKSHLVVVASWHAFPEAMPFVIQEGLAVRRPIVLSDHPVFRKYFVDGQAVRIFTAGSPTSLANTIAEVVASPQAYADLARQTAEVWQSLQIPTKYHDLLARLVEEWQVAEAKAAILAAATDFSPAAAAQSLGGTGSDRARK